MILTFLGIACCSPLFLLIPLCPEVLVCALQLPLETLVAIVLILRVLELLYRVNALVDVLALEVVDIELRQLLLLAGLDDIRDGEDPKSGPIPRVDGGDTGRGPLRSTETPDPYPVL